MYSENADENWLGNERNHIQGRRKYLNMILQQSTDIISGFEEEGEKVMPAAAEAEEGGGIGIDTD